MKTLADVIALFNEYSSTPTTTQGHAILKMIKSGQLQTVLNDTVYELERIEDTKIFDPQGAIAAALDKYNRIVQITHER